jgi:hypothetical protein
MDGLCGKHEGYERDIGKSNGHNGKAHA